MNLRSYRNRHSRKSKLGRMVWSVVWMMLFRVTPRWCLNGWRCFLLRLFGAKVGRDVRIQGSVKIWQPWRLTIGDNSWIDGGVSLYSVDAIEIGSNAVVSEGAFICTASHDISSATFELMTKPVIISDNAWVCARVTVLPGVNIGEGAVAAAGSVVTSNIDPWTVAGGNPAKMIGARTLHE